MRSIKLESLWRRGSRTAPLWLAALLLFSTGCVATKKDVRTLQQELAGMRARQDSLHRELQRQDRVLLDTLRRSNEFARDMQSRLTGQIREIKDLIEVLNQLVGQTQQRIAEARAEVQRLQQQVPPPTTTPPGSEASAMSADQLFQIGRQKYDEKSTGTARAAFEELLRDFPNHALAADAQYYLAETFVLDDDAERAYQEFERVVEMYPSSTRARMALYRAGVVAEDKRDRAKARQFYSRLTRAYPNTDEARLAEGRLRALRE